MLLSTVAVESMPKQCKLNNSREKQQVQSTNILNTLIYIYKCSYDSFSGAITILNMMNRRVETIIGDGIVCIVHWL